MGVSKSYESSNKLVIISILYAIWIYVAAKTPFHYYDILLAFGLFGSVFLLAIVLFAVNTIAIFTHKNILPFAVFIVCALVPWLMPSITPEDVYFARYQTEYEKVVEMARQHQVENGESCKYNENFIFNEYLPPKGYEYLTTDKCIEVRYEPTLEVVFTPRVGGRFLFYAETLLPHHFCDDGFGLIEKKLDDHWYICKEYWN